MPKTSTLERIETEIETGDLGKARDRLHGLISTYPDDLTLRARLAQVYWALQYPEMAGRYWFFEAAETDEIRTAQTAFARQCGNDPVMMLRALKFRGDPDSLPPFARQHLDQLIAECQRKHAFYPIFEDGQANWQHTEQAEAQGKVLLFGLIAVFSIVMIFAIIGLIAVLSWLL